MSIVLYHHPFSRAATVVWMLEELGVPYELRFVDLMTGAQKSDAHRALNPMGKVPVLVDGGEPIMETAAIGMYLADRYAPGRLAPALDDPARGPYLRWCVYSPSVIEPACMARAAKWEYRAGQAGFGSYEDVVATLEQALAKGPWLLGDRFTMADMVVGASVRWMSMFKMIDPHPVFAAYIERLNARPSWAAAVAKNGAVAAEHGLNRG